MSGIHFLPWHEDITWLKVLPQNESKLISDLLSSNPSEEEISKTIQSWFSVITPMNKSTKRNMEYYFLVKKEVFKFLCGDPVYDIERKKINLLNNSLNWEVTLVTVVSTIMGSQLGIIETLVAPIVVIIFIMISKITLNTWCNLKFD